MNHVRKNLPHNIPSLTGDIPKGEIDNKKKKKSLLFKKKERLAFCDLLSLHRSLLIHINSLRISVLGITV